MRKLWSSTGAGLAALVGAGAARAADLLGQPTPGAIDFQPAGSILKQQAITFHNWILMPIITAIALLILALLAICIVRFNKRANPTPARWSHNTTVEILWTALPVLILTFIAIFSFKLLFAYADMPRPDLTVKATGYQWYWGYAYPDQKIDEYTSNILPEDKAKAAGAPWMLATTAPLVVPVNKTVHVLVVGADVIHSFSVPAFGIKIDAVPGRTNDTWFKATQTGTFYGQCSQLCGTDHSYMPIEVKVVSQADFDAWVASKATPAAPASNAAAPTNSTAPEPTAAATPAAPVPAKS
jgi:cytochrome c oxidase subunit 2